MKKFLSNLTKIISLILVVSLSIITFAGCSEKNKQSSMQPSPNNISDTNTNENGEITADNISDDQTEESEESSTQKNPSFIGIYKFSDLTLGYEDIYFENKEELLTFFKTRDLNGVYDIINKLGFSDFTTNLTSFESDTKYERAFSLALDITDDTNYCLINLYINNIDTFTSTSEEYVDLTAKENILTASNDIIKIIYNQETDTYSILYSFYYIDSETQEIIYTPLYVKTEIYNYIKVTPENFSEDALFTYVKDSARLESSNGIINNESAIEKLVSLFPNNNNDIIKELSNWTILLNNDMTELFIMFDDTLIYSSTNDNNNLKTFSIYNSLTINIVNDIYNINQDTHTINIEINIDSDTTFKCSFVSLSSLI